MLEFLLLLGLIVGLIFWRSVRSVANETKIKEDARRRRAKCKLKPLPPRFVVLDLETTGLSADRHEIIEIGAIKFDCTQDVHATFQSLIIPAKRISAKVTELTGLDRKT